MPSMLSAAWYARVLLGAALLLALLPGCDSGADDDLNRDIPEDPDTAPPPDADGPLIPSITLGDLDPANPARIPLVVGGVSYVDEDSGDLVVVDFDSDNLTVVVDGVVQGARISTGASVGFKADIVFVIDNTGSMAEEISGVRSSVLSFVSALRAGGQDIAAGVVAYNDELPESFDSGVPVSDTRAHPAVYGFVDLSTDLSTASGLYEFVSDLPATDGGDTPELGIGGLDYARRTFDWRDGAQRIYIVVTDATTWGRGIVDASKGIDASYPSIDTLGETLVADGSVVHVYSPDLTGDSFDTGEYDMRDLATATGGIWSELDRTGDFDLTDLGIVETTLATSLVEFVRDTDGTSERTVRVVVRVRDGSRTIDGERTVRLRF